MFYLNTGSAAGVVGSDKQTLVLLTFLGPWGSSTFGVPPEVALQIARGLCMTSADAQNQHLLNVLKDVSDMGEALAAIVRSDDHSALPALVARIRERVELPTTNPEGGA